MTTHDDLAPVAATAAKHLTAYIRSGRTRDVVDALSKSGTVAELTNDPLRLLVNIETLLDHLVTLPLASLAAKERGAARHAVDGIEARLAQIRTLLAPTKRASRKV